MYVTYGNWQLCSNVTVRVFTLNRTGYLHWHSELYHFDWKENISRGKLNHKQNGHETNSFTFI